MNTHAVGFLKETCAKTIIVLITAKPVNMFWLILIIWKGVLMSVFIPAVHVVILFEPLRPTVHDPSEHGTSIHVQRTPRVGTAFSDNCQLRINYATNYLNN